MILVITIGISAAVRTDQQALIFAQTGAAGTVPSPSGQLPATGTMPPGVAANEPGIHAVPSLVGQPMLYEAVPVRDVPSQDPRVTMRPGVAIASIGTNVPIRAGVLYPDGYLRTNQRIDWTLSGVGYISTVDTGTWTDFFVGDWTRAGRINNRSAVNSTSRRPLTATGGTPASEDDVSVFPGEAVISVTSMTEGTTYVTANAAKITDGNNGQRVAVVHWVDASWTWPDAPIAPAGKSRLLTTRIVRRTSGLPCVGWVVRYRFVSGVEAGFGTNLEQMVDVATDRTGQAVVEIAQPNPRPGESRIEVDVIWPGRMQAAGIMETAPPPVSTADQEGVKSLTVARTTLPVVWTPSDLTLSISGPSSVNPGDLVDYRIAFSNEGAWPSPTAQLSLQMPAGVRAASLPSPARLAADARSWSATLLPLEPGETRETTMQVVAATPGRYPIRASIIHQGNVLATESITTQVGTPVGGYSPSIDYSTPIVPPIADVDPGGGETLPPVDIFPAPQGGSVIVRPDSSELPKLDLVIITEGTTTADLRVGRKIPIFFSVLNEETDIVKGCTLCVRFGDAFSHENGGDRVVIELPDLPARGWLPDATVPEILLEIIRATDSVISAQVWDSRGNVIVEDYFTLTTLPADGQSPGTAESGTESTGLQASVRMSHGTITGEPGEIEVGEAMRVQVEVTNAGYQSLENVRLSCRPDPVFKALQATTGHQNLDGGYVFDLPSLAPGDDGAFAVDLQPLQAQPDAVIQMSVLQDGRVVAEEIVRLNVMEAPVIGN